MNAPVPTSDFLASQVRWAMGRGLPAQVAEDVVFEAWERASRGYDGDRGGFEPYMQTAVRNACAYWWRSQKRAEQQQAQLRLVSDIEDASVGEGQQQQLLAALTEEERAVFAAWALQKHLGKGRVSSAAMGQSLGLDAASYDNAKRRLKDQLHRLLHRFGWTSADLFTGEADVG